MTRPAATPPRSGSAHPRASSACSMRSTASSSGRGSVATSMAPSPNHLATRTPTPAGPLAHDGAERRQRRDRLADPVLVGQRREPAQVDEREVPADQRVGVLVVGHVCTVADRNDSPRGRPRRRVDASPRLSGPGRPAGTVRACRRAVPSTPSPRGRSPPRPAPSSPRDGVVDAAGPTDWQTRIASVTKPLVALAALVAVEEGTLDLEAPAGPPGATVRHLLAHASGPPVRGRRAPVAARAGDASTPTPASRSLGDALAPRPPA